MGEDIVKIYSEYSLLLSENQTDSDTLDAKFIICDFNPNKNRVSLNRETIDQWLSTLQIKPLVGKVVTKYNGVSDFTGHNAKIVEKEDEDGNKYRDVEFDSSAFGSFYESSVETINDQEYIVASAKIWKRFSAAYDVIKRRVDSSGGIKTSWEIQVLESHYENIGGQQIKVIDKGNFIGHALLGENVEPAYDNSGLLQVASANETDTELAEALVVDIKNSIIETKEESILPKETSALTIRDLYQKVSETLNPKGWSSNPYYSVWEIYPEEHKVLAYNIDRSSDDEYIVFTYSVSEDSLDLGEGTATKLSKILAEKTNVNINLDLSEAAKLLSTKEQELASLLARNEEMNTELSNKTDALVTASAKIEALENSVSELTPYKERVEAIEQAEAEAHLSAKKAAFKAEVNELAKLSGLISLEEIETSEEINALIENNDMSGIKAIIADRFINKLAQPEVKSEVHTSTKTDIAKTIINNEEEESIVDHKLVMSSFFTN